MYLDAPAYQENGQVLNKIDLWDLKCDTKYRGGGLCTGGDPVIFDVRLEQNAYCGC